MPMSTHFSFMQPRNGIGIVSPNMPYLAQQQRDAILRLIIA